MGVHTARERHSSATEKSMSSQSCRISNTFDHDEDYIIMMTLTMMVVIFLIDNDDDCGDFLNHRLFAIESACRNLYKDLNHLEENLWRWLGLQGWQFYWWQLSLAHARPICKICFDIWIFSHINCLIAKWRPISSINLSFVELQFLYCLYWAQPSNQTLIQEKCVKLWLLDKTDWKGFFCWTKVDNTIKLGQFVHIIFDYLRKCKNLNHHTSWIKVANDRGKDGDDEVLQSLKRW